MIRKIFKLNFSVAMFSLFLMLFTGTALANEEGFSNGVVDFIPLWQEQTRAVGATPPKPFFIAPLLFYMEDKMSITDVNATADMTKVPGFEILGPEMPADVTMTDVRTTSTTYGIRAGAWIFPFLSIYGMYAHSEGNTSFLATAKPIPGVIPNGFSYRNKTNFKADTYAVGATAAYGVKNMIFGWDVFGNMDINFSWTKADILDNTIQMVIFSPRVGVARDLFGKYNIAIWIGGMYKDDLNLSERVGGQYVIQDGSVLDGRPIPCQYTAKQRPLSPWNMVAGLKVSPCRYFDFVFEAGFINRLALNANIVFNF